MEHQTKLQRWSEALTRVLRHWHRSEDAVAIASEPAFPAYTIAISRQAGALGPAIARAVGERLGWPVYDRELVEEIAREMKLRTRLVESIDERRRSWLEECWKTFTAHPHVSQNDYLRHLSQVLFSLASHGNCMIVGRGAAQLLPEATTLRVRLMGTRAARVAGLEERFDLSTEEAERWIDQTDERRTRFVRDNFNKDPEDSAGYDLILNSTRLGVEGCAEVIVTTMQRMKATQPACDPAAEAVTCQV